MAYCISFFTTGVDIEFQAILIAANDHLQKCYINSRYSPTVDDWPPYQPRHYTTLALIHHKDKCTDAAVISVTQELAVAGKIQPKVEGLSSSGGSMSQTPNIYSNTTKNISNIFVSVKASDGLTINPCIILIEGAPGIGKTVLAKEIAFQWANNKLLSDKKILLLLFLRECNFKSMVSVENLVQHVVKSNKRTASLSEYLLQTEGKDLAIVLDGYDEVSEEDRKYSIIAHIIYRRIFSKCCLVITSRPTASSNLHSVVDCRVEVVGFTEEDRLDYIQTALQGNDDKIKALTLYLQSNPTINALCYIPLNMTILLCLAENGIDKLPKTQTDMYKKFIEMAILRFIQKVDTEVSKVITSIADLPHPHDKVFEELTRLAYKALKIDKIVFRLNEIKAVCPNLATISSNWNGLGLLKTVQYFNAEIGNVTFHFLHFSIQEYMAALYISTLSDKKQIKLLKQTFWQHRYYNTWIMYVGITCGSSFALKHFLSGNWFQISTRIFKYSNISRKYLGNKIKCLHLFQCLVESNNEDMIATVSKFFQDNQIDLDRQTLLPSDVNTLGFFLMRSINKRWKMLNLSDCNIGSIGINILYDRFLSKESRDIVFIKTVDFSYNQLNFSSVIQIFDLFKSWHTSQLIIKDSEILQDHVNSSVYKAIEDAFLTSNYDNQVSLELGKFCFGHKIKTLPLSAVFIKYIYLLNCKLVSILELLANKSVSEIHLINTSLPNQEMKRLCSNLLNTGNPSLFIYNPELPDQDADEICSLILSSHKIPNGIMLIISNSKIQGIINTSTISKQLTKLEILNLAVNVNQKCSNHTETFPWKGNLYCDGSNNDFIDYIFIELLYKITCNKWNWQLKILLKEKDILIAHGVNHECISEKIRMYQSLKAIYLSNCNIKTAEYQMLFETKRTLTKLYIFNSSIDQNWLTKLKSNLLVCKEMFIHSLCDIHIEEILRHFTESCSTVLVTKNEMFGCNPTTKQIALAFQLEKSIDVLKLLHCQGSFNCFDQIITMLTTTQNSWTELDFMNCELGEIEYEILQKHLKINKQNSTIKKLKVSSKQLTELLVPKFIAIILMWKVQQIIFSDISHTVYECFVIKFTTNVPIDQGEFFLSVTYISNKDIYFCNYSWNQITKLLERNSGAALYIFNCYFSLQSENLNIIILSHISKLHITNSSLHEDTMVNILETFVERKLEISICNTSKHIDDQALYNFITSKKLLYQSRVNFVAVMKNFMCGYNTTKDQLQFLQSQKLNDLEHTIVALVSDTKQTHEKQLFVFQNKQLTALHFVGKDSEAKFFTALVGILKRISTLKCFGIDKYTITSEVAIDIANILSHNKGLEQLYFNSKLRMTDLLKILKVLAKFINLKILEIGNENSISDEAANDIAAVIYSNTQLQEFDVSKNNLQSTGAIKIAKPLQNISTLTKLYLNNNHITDLAADDIAAVIYRSTQLQEVDVSRNSFQSTGAIKIAKALQHISTLTKLYLNNNHITDLAADDIATVLSRNTHLQELSISENNFQSTGTKTITKALQSGYILRKLYISNNNITAEAADDIAAVIYRSTRLQEVDVSRNSFQSTGAIKIAKALQNISTLTKLYLNNNHITDLAADDIATVLSRNTQLQELDISENNFQTTGAKAITKALQNGNILRKLYISNNNITAEAADDIAAVIYRSTQLQEVDVSRNSFQSTGAIKILKAVQISTITKLHINSIDFTYDAAADIAAAVSHNTHLQELDISNNQIEAVGIMKIAKALQCNDTLKKLYMSRIRITDKVADIATALSINVQLQELDISKNMLQTNGIKPIAKVLQGIVTLTKLYINENGISDNAADDIAAVIHSNTQLQEFNISKNIFEVLGIMTIATALQSVSTLTKLYINNNNITSESADDIAAVICCNTHLQEFDISENKLQATGVIIIAKALQSIATLKKFYISNNIYIDKNAYTEGALSDIENTTEKAAYSFAEAVSHNVKLQEINFSENYFPATGIVKIMQVLQSIFTINKLYVININITEEAADDFAAALAFNTQLQELDISRNNLQTQGTIKIAKAIQGIFTLKILRISNNNIADDAADSIAAALSHNYQLEVFTISRNYVGAPGMIKIARGLQQISTLQRLYINRNRITDEAADDIAAICSHNTQLRELFINSNLFTNTKIVELKDRCHKLNSDLYIRTV